MINVKINIKDLVVGDTIVHNGKEMTVGSKDIKYGFCGITVFGDSYNCGYKLVTKVIY